MEETRREVEAVQEYIRSLSECDVSSLNELQLLRARIASFSGDREQLDELCEELSNIQAKRSTYKKLFRELQNSREEVQELSLQHQECTQELDYGMTMQKNLFEKVFGLKIKLTADKAVSFEFLHLHPSHMDTVCSVTLDVNSGGQWEVVQLEPSVPDVRPLLDQLNQTNRLELFCKHLRHKFKEHLMKIT